MSERPTLNPRERMAIDRHADARAGRRSARSRNFEEVNLGFTQLLAAAEAERCLQCKNPKCIDGCPVRVNIPRFIDLVAQGQTGRRRRVAPRRQRAALRDRSRLPAGDRSARAPACAARRARRWPSAPSSATSPTGRWATLRPSFATSPIAPSGRSVAVVGSGPAGLTCAGELAKSGHQVTIFEAFHAPGGVLIYGIPEFRLPKDIVAAGGRPPGRGRASRSRSTSSSARPGRCASCASEFDAVFIAVGAGLPVFMDVPGENLKGVYSANEYLTRVNLMGAFREDADTPVLHGPARGRRRRRQRGHGRRAHGPAPGRRRGHHRLPPRPRRAARPRARRSTTPRRRASRFELLTAPVEVLGDEDGLGDAACAASAWSSASPTTPAAAARRRSPAPSSTSPARWSSSPSAPGPTRCSRPRRPDLRRRPMGLHRASTRTA